MRRAALANLRITLLVVVAPVFLLAGAGLALPPYAGPQPPTTAMEWAHRSATYAGGFIVSRAAAPYLLICAGMLLLYIWSRRRRMRSDAGRRVESRGT